MTTMLKRFSLSFAAVLALTIPTAACAVDEDAAAGDEALEASDTDTQWMDWQGPIELEPGVERGDRVKTPTPTEPDLTAGLPSRDDPKGADERAPETEDGLDLETHIDERILDDDFEMPDHPIGDFDHDDRR